MAQILETETSLNVVGESFALLTEYIGATNPNVRFDVTFNVSDVNGALEGAVIKILGIDYTTDISGQKVISLNRGDYLAEINLLGHVSQTINFTIFDANIIENVILILIGSFSQSFDNSYENF